MEKRIVLPMVLGWPVYSSDNSVNSLVTIVNDTDASDVQSKNTHILVSSTENKNNRTSKRNKKLPCTRTDDFFMVKTNLKTINDAISSPIEVQKNNKIKQKSDERECLKGSSSKKKHKFTDLSSKY
jgi:hypothetical protein